MSVKSIVLYVLIGILGIAVGILATLSLQPAATQSEHSADDGHNHGATPVVANAVGDPSDWCSEHRVPESQCTHCHSDLIAAFKKSGDWCVEHALPESHCRLCNPGLTFPQEPILKTAVETYIKPDVYFPANASRCETDRAVIQFASAATIERAGLSLEPALAAGNDGELLEIPAEVVYDETRTHALTIAIPATILRWLAEAGDAIQSTSTLCELDSPEMAELQASYVSLLAEERIDRKNCSRADSLLKTGLISAAEHEEIQAELAMTTARLSGQIGQLRAAGLTETQIAAIETQGVSSLWQLQAKLNGSLLERRAPLGVRLDAGSTISIVGDHNALWIQGHIRERDVERLKVGQRVEFSADGNALERTAGEIFWIAQYIDPATRTVLVRAEVTTPAHTLRANRFGRMLVPGSPGGETVLVPRDAVQWEGCCNVVFVASGENRFQPHKVEIARGDRSHYRVNSGLKPGELVVVGGSYLLKTELMKGSMGTGCCGLEPEL